MKYFAHLLLKLKSNDSLAFEEKTRLMSDPVDVYYSGKGSSSKVSGFRSRLLSFISPNTINVTQMGVGLSLLFFAFFSQSLIEETVLQNRSKVDPSISSNAGYVSQTIIYASFLLMNLVAPPIVDFLGCRWSLVIGSLTYTFLMASFLFLQQGLLYFASALQGAGSGILWTGVGHYLAVNSNERTIGRNSSLIWILHTSGLVTGGIFLLGAFGTSQASVQDIDEKMTRLLYGGFSAVSLIGAVVLGILRTPSEEQEFYLRSGSYLHVLGSTFRLLMTKDMLLFSVTSAFAGLEMSFWSVVYSTALSFTKAFQLSTKTLMAYNAIAVGLGEIAGSCLCGLYSNRSVGLSGWRILCFSTMLSSLACLFTYLNLPSASPYLETTETAYITPSIPIALLCGAIFGIVDACVNTQIYSFVSIRYRGETLQAFAISKFFHALLSAISMYYGSLMPLVYQLMLFVAGSILSTASFMIVEQRFRVTRQCLANLTCEELNDDADMIHTISYVKESGLK